MRDASVLRWPATTAPLVDRNTLIFPLASTTEAEARALVSQMPRLLELAALLRRYDMAVQSVIADVVETASLHPTGALATVVSQVPYALRLVVQYPDYMSVDDMRRRRLAVLHALASL